MEPLLEIKDLYVEYKTGRATAKAINGLNMTIMPGEAFGLVGETGAGKTTTALSILNLLPRDVGKITKGEIIFKGKSVLNMSEKELTDMRGDSIAMIFQNPLSSLNPVFTIGEQIGIVLEKHQGMNKKQSMEQAGQLLKTVGIPANRAADYPHQLSGGMRQRVGIAAALACNPDLLIADEPTTALDVTIQAQILELMKDLQEQRTSSLLMITHNLGIIAELCQKVAVMYAGAIVEIGNVQDVFTHPAHWYTKSLLGAIPRIDGKADRLANIPGNASNSQRLADGCKFHPRCVHCTERCKTEMPPLVQVSDGHYAACWEMEV